MEVVEVHIQEWVLVEVGVLVEIMQIEMEEMDKLGQADILTKEVMEEMGLLMV